MTLFSTRYMKLEQFAEERYFRLTRSAERFELLDDAVAAFAGLNAALDRAGRSRYGFLVDTRLAPLRNDPTFEDAIGPGRKRSTMGFSRCAILLRSAMGKIQMSRLEREDGMTMLITLDEAEALAYVQGR